MRFRSYALAVALFGAALLAAPAPAPAYDFIWTCRGENTTWGGSNVTFEPTTASFPAGSAWQASLESMRTAWNVNSPNTNFNFLYSYVTGNAFTAGDGRNTILVTNGFGWQPTELAVTLIRTNKGCPIWPFSRPDIAEADVLFNPNWFWDNDTNPVVPLNFFSPNSTLVGIHEFGHAFGLDHENDLQGTMDAIYPNGGPLGRFNEAHPHADDVRGNIAGYGAPSSLRDVAASAFRRTAAGNSAEIPAPASVGRGVPQAIQFTLENRGRSDQNSVRTQFFLSTDRVITTGDTLLGTATMNMPAFFTGTMTANVTVPVGVTPGTYFIGYIVDSNNLIAETNEGNNSVAFANPTTVTNANAPPTACFTVTPISGVAPLTVTVNASCSSDPDGSITNYSWDMGNGILRTGQSFSFTYFDPGSYFIILTVRDNNGATANSFDFVNVLGDCGGRFCEEPF